MKGLLNYGWALLAALLLHGALALGLNTAIRFRAPERPGEAKSVSLQLLILPPPQTESKAPRVLQSRPKPAAVLEPAPVTEEVKSQEATVQPEAEPLLQPSQAPKQAAGEMETLAGEPEILEREVSAGAGVNGSPSSVFSSLVGFRDVISEPRPLSAIDPLFPIGSRIRGEQGDVRFQVWISANGRLERTQILQTSGYPSLDEAAERALKKTRFAPRQVNGSTVRGTLTITVRFRLER
jgi:protein TonB